jgi:hypothetical protein
MLLLKAIILSICGERGRTTTNYGIYTERGGETYLINLLAHCENKESCNDLKLLAKHEETLPVPICQSNTT